MRNTIIAGLTTALTAAAVAAPAQAQTTQAPTVHIKNCKVSKSLNGYAVASCSIVAANLPSKGVDIDYKSNMKPFNPGTQGPWRSTSGKVGLGSGDSILAIKFAYKGKTPAQVRKSLKVTISNATGGVKITDATAVAQQS